MAGRAAAVARPAPVTTDGSWRTAPGPWDSADLYNGETHDARRVEAGWAEAGFDDSAWDPAVGFAPKVGELVAPPGPPVRRIEELPVADVLATPSGRTVLDFGQNLVGWVRFTVEGEAGTTVTLRHAEVLEHGELGTRPLRNAEATDRYTLRGGGPETWEPSFTFHGLRYVEVDGWPGTVDPAARRGRRVRRRSARPGGARHPRAGAGQCRTGPRHRRPARARRGKGAAPTMKVIT